MGVVEDSRRHALLRRQGHYYRIARGGMVVSGAGHPFRSKRAARLCTRLLGTLTRSRWRIYRVDS